MPFFARFALAVALLAGTHFAIAAAKARYEFEVAAPAFDLDEMPTEIGDHAGRKTEVDDGVRGTLQAKTTVNRLYEADGLPAVRVHAAVWADRTHVIDACPHHPDVCYRAQGWKTESTEEIVVPVDGFGDVPVRLAVMSREYERIVVAHSYRLGAACYTAVADARPTLERLRGSREWPHVMKLMIHIAAADLETAEPLVERFVADIYGWLGEVDPVVGAGEPAAAGPTA